MDHSEQSLNQLQQNSGGATQIPAAPAFCAAPVAATSDLCAPVSLPPLRPQASNSRNQLTPHQAEHFNNLRQRLQLFWETQKQQVEETTNFKNHSVPLARIKKIMKADDDVNMIAAEAPVLFAKAVEMFILDLTLRGWTHTEEDRRRTLQTSDIAAAISENEIFDFLDDVIPKDLLKPTNATIPQVGSSIATYPYVPQHYPVGPSGTVMYPGGQPHPQPPLQPYMAWPQEPTEEQLSMPWAPQPDQQQNNLQQPRQNQEPPFMPWEPQPEADQQQNQEESSMPPQPDEEQESDKEN